MRYFVIWEVGSVSGLPMLVGRTNWVCGYSTCARNHTHTYTHTPHGPYTHKTKRTSTKQTNE